MMQHLLPGRTRKSSDKRDTGVCATCDGEFLDEALSRVGRLESVLAATGGALHDVNNMLTVLSGNLYLMTEAVRGEPVLLEKCRDARNTASRASVLIRELLGSARDTQDHSAVICPARHVAGMESILRRGIDSNHSFRVRHSLEPWTVAASAAQFESAIANLVINANDAMREPGSIEVRIQNVELDRRAAAEIDLAPGKYVRSSVIDTGTGIPPGLRARLTEPLVTTKISGCGNGMGLAMVQRFAARANGALKIASKEGSGTTMAIWLPYAAGNADTTANMTMPLSTLPAGHETVLVVTNNADVQRTLQELLDALGYAAISARDRSDALDCARRVQKVSIVICDRFAGDRPSARKWLRALQHSQPEIRQLAIVGLGEEGAKVAPDADAYLHSPVAIEELADSLRAVMGASA